MGRFTRLPAALLFRLGLITCCGALLAGLMLIMLGLPHSGQARGGAPTGAAFATHTPTPTRKPSLTATSTRKPAPTSTSKPARTATPKPAATSTRAAPTATVPLAQAAAPSTTPGAKASSTAPATATPARSKGALASAPPWLMDGLAGVFVILLAFSLIIFPIAMRSARAERRSRPAFTVAPPRRPSGQVARLTQIPPERKQPLSREQMMAVRESQKLAAVSGVSERSTASLAAIRVVDGVPISLPITEAETAPQAPASHRSMVGKIVESTTARMPAVRPTSALPPPAQQTQQES